MKNILKQVANKYFKDHGKLSIFKTVQSDKKAQKYLTQKYKEFEKKSDINQIQSEVNDQSKVSTHMMNICDQLFNKGDKGYYDVSKEINKNKLYYDGNFTTAVSKEVKVNRMLHKKFKQLI